MQQLLDTFGPPNLSLAQPPLVTQVPSSFGSSACKASQVALDIEGKKTSSRSISPSNYLSEEEKEIATSLYPSHFPETRRHPKITMNWSIKMKIPKKMLPTTNATSLLLQIQLPTPPLLTVSLLILLITTMPRLVSIQYFCSTLFGELIISVIVRTFGSSPFCSVPLHGQFNQLLSKMRQTTWIHCF
jgi:hypothetical protein